MTVTSFAQEKSIAEKDSIKSIKIFYPKELDSHAFVPDTTRIFPNLETNNKKTKFGRFINKLIYKNNKRLTSRAPEIKTNQHLELGHGKVIRNIRITSLDPFGYSTTDTAKKPTSNLEHFGNKMHLKTKRFTINNFLMFKEGEVFDSLKVRESERLLRTQRFVRAVTIYPIPTSSPDSVDVLVRELDSWSIYPSGSISTSTARFKVTDRNFGGFGHDVSLQYKTRLKEDKDAFYFNYRVNNIQNTFVRANILYDSDLWGNYVKVLAVDRPFYSPYTKWAGGVTVSQIFRRDSLPDMDMKYKLESVKSNTFDYWAGYSIPLFKSYKDKPVITNLRTSVRFIQQHFLKTPDYVYDPLGFYGDQRTYLASISLSSINYVQDRFIFSYDRIEDVQVGKTFALTAGMKDQYQKRRSYFGAKFAIGGYTNLGYFATNLEWGSYFHGSRGEQGALRIDASYFTKLFVWGNWRFRHFIMPQFVMGYHRIDHTGDRLKLEDVIQGIRAQKILGTRRLSLGYQWQSYAPYEWKGFRINPFLNFEGAFMGYEKERFLDPKFYSRISIGLVANNDYLVFSSIALSLVYYPTMPDSGKPVFFANSRQYNLDLPNFNYDRPRPVSYY
ncbi:hypothetical protein [Myroides sp. LoEW2-1]|uniref:hypothetical protein n=1 Tax=Myroides sp. LoEW2-1 TaxID=2683192 RepID=UPI001FB5F8A8|nr:hypothetical protein [Myroides sp. LoEW2-1]